MVSGSCVKLVDDRRARSRVLKEQNVLALQYTPLTGPERH